jgi:hypothetical protein
MSQHQIQVQSPKLGTVEVTVGFDPVLNEAFLSFFNDRAQYMSPSGLPAAELQGIAQKELGLSLPQQVIDGVQGDIADLRCGATDVGRRVKTYRSDGALIDEVVY